jgi:hypothetical protein
MTLNTSITHMGMRASRRTPYITTPRSYPLVYADHCHSSTHGSADALSDVVLSAPTTVLEKMSRSEGGGFRPQATGYSKKDLMPVASTHRRSTLSEMDLSRFGGSSENLMKRSRGLYGQEVRFLSSRRRVRAASTQRTYRARTSNASQA